MTQLLPSAGAWRAFWAIFALVCAWLAWAAYRVNIDFDDGYATIVNAQYVLGLSDHYYWQRLPGFSWLLVPAEWLSTAIGLHPLDVRLHHATTALLSAIYLFGVWWLLQRQFGATIPSLLAWMAALLTPVFFSYAPFVNQDILPGLLLLLLIWATSEFSVRGGRRLWWLMFATGAALALIKQNYALAWVAVLLSQFTLLLLQPEGDRTPWRRVLGVVAAAVAGGVVCFVVYSALLANSFPDTSFWQRPFGVLSTISRMYDGEGGGAAVFYQWIYFRNLSAYGFAAILLMPFGLVLNWRTGDSFQRSVVICLLLLIVAMQIIPFKEVRYLGFLAPLLAVLLVPVLSLAWTHSARWRWILLLLIGLDVTRNLPEAVRLRDNYYSQGVTEFFRELPAPSATKAHIFFDQSLTFVSPESTAFFADRYHRITHIGEQAAMMYGYPSSRWSVQRSATLKPDQVQVGDFLVLSTNADSRSAPFVPGNREGLRIPSIQGLARAEWTTVELRDGQYWPVGGSAGSMYLLIGSASGDGRDSIAIGNRFAVQPILTITGEPASVAQTRVKTFRFLKLCQREQCRQF